MCFEYSIGMHIRPYQKLIVWQEAHKLCMCIYAITREYPKDERFGLVSQMRRSSSSIPTNIAEGNAKKSTKERSHFFEISKASLEELHYQCFLSKDLQYISERRYEELDDHIQRVRFILEKLRKSLK